MKTAILTLFLIFCLLTSLHAQKPRLIVDADTGNELDDFVATARALLCWEHELNRAVRLGNWKLESKRKLLNGVWGKWRDYEMGTWELYDMKTDRIEINDLSGKFPEKVNEMDFICNDFVTKTSVFPTPWK
jgi:hypothetical protein